MAKLDKKLAHDLKLGINMHTHSYMKSHSPVMCHLMRIYGLGGKSEKKRLPALGGCHPALSTVRP